MYPTAARRTPGQPPATTSSSSRPSVPGNPRLFLDITACWMSWEILWHAGDSPQENISNRPPTSPEILHNRHCSQYY
ncbi:hypothetical protein A0H81_13169 [Grifola frondosa]|uniref:Uncharacterized protein n=1 Tax=Grifola frondosa TaxID=5627 RepID=A0A1C7LVM3_GRIFR|nr:hypothetical protein A0H81_13169 [Grifola frondosa]